ncbi:MAG TPA: response regulator [Pirellulales bacterium]|nr:response regulator [Pirellulales bacterium]
MLASNLKILIVDDDEVSLAISRRTVEQAGYAVESARNGREALDVLARGECRLVITDWMMPEMDGVELCRQIRARDFCGYIYVIVLTSKGEKKDIVEGLTAGADDFLTKPFDPAELQVRVCSGKRILALETRDLAIFALAKLAESRDPETGAHLERMRSYARILAGRLAGAPKYSGLVDLDYVRTIYLTSPLHDIGKVGIPDRVLLKAGPLDEQEFEIMKRHTLIGAETLDAALCHHRGARFLEMGRDIALTHHERWDGGGYPQGLAGEGIPLCGRIVTVADVYDALTTKRSYKEAFAHDLTRSIIVEESGTHFDPDVVGAFLDCEEEFIRVRAQFAECESLAELETVQARKFLEEAVVI